MIVRGGDGATILSFMPPPPVEISILDLPYAQALLLAALDLLQAVEDGDEERVERARDRFREMLVVHAGR